MPEVEKVLVDGDASGIALVLDAPLSFWGGLDSETGTIIDRRHPQAGASVTGRMLVMESGRGSSSAPSVLAEAVRLGTAPAAIIMREPDEIVALGAIVGEELYATTIPVVVLDPTAFGLLSSDCRITIRGSSLEIDVG